MCCVSPMNRRRGADRHDRPCCHAQGHIARSPPAKPTATTQRSSTSPAEQPAPQKARSTSTAQWHPSRQCGRRTRPPRRERRRSLLVHPDPGWVTGTSYGIIAPLTLGITTIVDQAEFDAKRWYGVLQDQRVTVWYTAPTAIQRMMRVGANVARQYDTSSLRFIASVGEPLPAHAVAWGIEAFGQPIHDNWWQTETGAIMIANVAGQPIRPGSMGKPLPGVEAGILVADAEGEVVRDANGWAHRVTAVDTPGMLALRPGWASMFRSYLNAPERYAKCFVTDESGDDWYISGDLASIDTDGYVWFVGRADDVIKTSGHLVGPFEIESVLGEHPAVAASGVFGKPDQTIGAIVKAIVVLRPGFEPSEETRRDLIAYGRRRLGPAVAATRIRFRGKYAGHPKRRDHATPPSPP